MNVISPRSFVPELNALLASEPIEMMSEAAALRDQGHGKTMSYSRKVFIPLTQLCRNVCHYCTFTQTPTAGKRVYM